MRRWISSILLFAATALIVTAAKAEDLRLIRVQGNVYLLAGGPVNITVQIGREGALLVDAPPADRIGEAMALIHKVSPLPIRYLISTAGDEERMGGDQALEAYAEPLPGNSVSALVGTGSTLISLVHANTLNRLDARQPDGRPVLDGGVISNEYDTPSKDFYMNDDAVIVYFAAAAHTDGDSMVHFRHADVLSTGDIFTPGQFPRVDLGRGGSVQGELAALNHLLEIAIPADYEEGGTYIIPGRGRICDEADLVEYRNMVRIVTDRVQDLYSRHQNLQQVLKTQPAFDYETEYGGRHGGPSADQFVAAVYESLARPPQALLDSFSADIGNRYGMAVNVTLPRPARTPRGGLAGTQP